MDKKLFYPHLIESIAKGEKRLAILLDPDKIGSSNGMEFLNKLPQSDYFYVGGSTVEDGKTDQLVKALKRKTQKPIVLFPGDINQITPEADSILFLSLMSGNNPEYLVGQQIKAAPILKKTNLEILPTAYILVDGGQKSSVERVSQTEPIPQTEIERIVNTCVAAEYSGKQLIYLETGSGAKYPINEEIVRQVKQHTSIPLIVGGGIRTKAQKQRIYNAGADLIVMGTVFESMV